MPANDGATPTDPWRSRPAKGGGSDVPEPSTLSQLLGLQRIGPRHAPSSTLRITRRFNAPAERVFRSWLDPKLAARWLFATAWHPMAHVQIDARVDGAFLLLGRRHGTIVEHAGNYLEIVPPRRLAFTLSINDGTCTATRVAVAIEPIEAGCDLTLVHESVPQARATRLEERWTGALYGLQETLDETDADFAATRRGS